MSLSFSPDGHVLAISTGTWRNAQSPGSVLLWDLKRKKVTVLTAEINKTADSVEFSEDGPAVAVFLDFALATAGDSAFPT
jgi:WD40 repeat protein